MGDLAYSPGMCPDWELNQRTFGSQAGAQSNERHQPGLNLEFLSGEGICKNKSKIKIILDKQWLKNVQHQQTHTIRNIKASSLGGRKIIPDENMNLHKNREQRT